MDVLTTSWQQVGLATPGTLLVQNVGETRIAYVLAAVAPGPTDIVLDSHEHFILRPGEELPYLFTTLLADAVSMFARSLGSKNGALAEYSHV